MSDVEREIDPELSAEANAILAYARRWGLPFTRAQIGTIAPGAVWDVRSRYPKTVAKRDPIAELVKAKMIEVVDQRETPVIGSRGHATIKVNYKVYALTDRERVPSLAELLDMLTAAVNCLGGTEGPRYNEIRAEILERFGRPEW